MRLVVLANVYFSYFDLLELMSEKVANAVVVFIAFLTVFIAVRRLASAGHRSIVSFCINDTTSADNDLKK